MDGGWVATPPWLWGDQNWDAARANLRGSLHRTTTAVDDHPGGATPEGMLDVAGNVLFPGRLLGVDRPASG